MGLADLHIHSIYSPDATITIRAILKQASDVQLNVIAITDHDEIRGALEAAKIAHEYDLEVVPGAEISTKDGHLVALFIHEVPPAGRSLIETLIAIGEQGGLAIAPHPFNGLPGSLSMEAVVGALTHPYAKTVLKGMETHNMSTHSFNSAAQKLAIYLPLAKIASSDAHLYWAIGAGRTQFEGDTAQDLRYAIENNATMPIPYEEELSARAVFSWMRRITLRQFGYASDSPSASQPINTQKIARTLIRKIKRKEPAE
ncbi:MAG: PHP domain-containing protein [Anaerolineales bacterium]|nr:PHP domain-containing protein [Anaerolineales bacterium]